MAHLGGVAAVGDRDAVDDDVGPLLGIGEIEVLDLEAAGQQVDQQRVRHRLARFELDADDQAVAFLERTRFPRLAVERVEAALDLDVVIVGRGCGLRNAGDVGRRVQRQIAFAA